MLVKPMIQSQTSKSWLSLKITVITLQGGLQHANNNALSSQNYKHWSKVAHLKVPFETKAH